MAALARLPGMIFSAAEWTALGVIATLVGVLVFVAVDRSAASRRRIKSVVDEYVRLAYGRPVLVSGARAFIRAGARSLKNDREVRAVVDELMDRYGGVGRHPLGSRTREILVKVRDLPAFLEEVGGNAEHFDDVRERYLGSS